MKKKILIGIVLSFFLFFPEKLLAEEVSKTCTYSSYASITDAGKITSSGSYAGRTVTLEIYTDGSNQLSGGPGGSEEVLNWGENTDYFAAVSETECPDYLVLMSNFYGLVGVKYYGVNEEDLMESATKAADNFWQTNQVSVFKNDNHQSQLGIYSCRYQFYTIVVNRLDKTLSLSTDLGVTSSLSYQIGETLESTWFSEDRNTDECLATVSCYNNIALSGMVTYYIFSDEGEAYEAGYTECGVKTCSGSDCNSQNYSCESYNKKLFCTNGDCDADDDSIEHYYYKISQNANGDNDQYYSKVHDIEKTTAAFCNAMLRSYDYSSNCVKACINYEKDLSDIKEKYGINSVTSDSNSCNISERLVAWLIRIVSWIRYIVPVVIIILTILDFIKAIAADNEDEIKKASGRFAKRLIVALIIFLLPLLLEFILGIFGQDTYQYCLK